MSSDNWPIVMYDGNGNYLEIQEDGQMELNGEVLTSNLKLREFIFKYAQGQAEE
jgi:hypothetical protein